MILCEFVCFNKLVTTKHGHFFLFTLMEYQLKIGFAFMFI